MPLVPGSNILLVKGNRSEMEMYKEKLKEIFRFYGVNIEDTSERLAAFYEVTNTYLSVFMTLGGFGMILGVVGLGFILLRNFNLRRKEFALLLAVGHPPRQIRRSVFYEHLLILTAGIIAGTIPALVATLPSLRSNAEIPWTLLFIMITGIFVTGIITLLFSAYRLTGTSLTAILRKD